MRSITIWFRMWDGFDENDTAVTLPMDDNHAEPLLRDQRLALDALPGATLDVLLHKLAILQGQHFIQIEKIEELS